MITHEDFGMVSKIFKKSPVTHVKKMINKKFTLTILLHIWLLKQNRFGELSTIKKMNSKTLTFTLQDMIQNELIRKKIYQKSPKITKYFITKKGKALVKVYLNMINFAMENYSKEILLDGEPKKIEEVFSKEMLRIIQK
ncbi:MAG: winged helix-turn-helix transcriptional regulator [Nitrosopumilus sp.]